MPKKKLNDEDTREKLIDITCDMIAEKNGSANINMRAVARRAGCAHTNVYSYFHSFNDLLYAAMQKTLQKLVSFTQAQVGTRPQTKEHFPRFIYAQIDFSIQYPGLFRFMWLDILTEPIPDNIVKLAAGLKNRFAELVYIFSNGKLTYEQAFEVSIIVHSYLHGEICKMISGRDNTSVEAARDDIKANVDRLLKLLISDAEYERHNPAE